MNTQEQELFEREQRVFARIGRLSYLVDEQGEALAQARIALNNLEAFLDEKKLRDEFNKYVESRQNGSQPVPDAIVHDEPEKQ